MTEVLIRVFHNFFKLEFLKPVSCAKVCTKSYFGGSDESERKLQLLKKGMALNYQHHWIVGKIFSQKHHSIIIVL